MQKKITIRVLLLFLIFLAIVVVNPKSPLVGMRSQACFAGEICDGDFEPDGDVDGADLDIFAADFGRKNCESAPDCEGDFNLDGDVDQSNLDKFAAHFGREDCPRIELKFIDAQDFELAGILQLGDPYNEVTRSSYWKPKADVLNGFHPLAYCGLTDIAPNLYFMPEVRKHLLVARDLFPEAEIPAFKPPVEYTFLWQATPPGIGLTFMCWRPVPPPDYVSLGDIVTLGGVDPSTTGVQCVLQSLVLPGSLGRIIHVGYNNNFPSGGFNTWRIDADNGFSNGNYSSNGISVNAFKGSYGPNYPDPKLLFVLNNRRVLSDDYLTPAEIDNLIDSYGPIFQFSVSEIFGPDHPAATLDDPVSKLEWCVVNPSYESDYDNFSFLVWPENCDVTSSNILQQVQDHVVTDDYYGALGFRYYVKLLQVLPGDYNRAKPLVHVRLRDHAFTEIQYWLWYPFNGPGRAHVIVSALGIEVFDDYYQLDEVGRHYGDWENVTLTFLTKTKELKYVEMSRHSTSQLFARYQAWYGGLGFSDTHPIFYVAKYSHAHYPLPGYVEYLYDVKYPGPGIVVKTYPYDQCDALGEYFPSEGRCDVIAAHYPGYQIIEPDWLKFDKPWGQYIHSKDIFDYGVYVYDQKEVSSGIRGPATKGLW